MENEMGLGMKKNWFGEILNSWIPKAVGHGSGCASVTISRSIIHHRKLLCRNCGVTSWHPVAVGVFAAETTTDAGRKSVPFPLKGLSPAPRKQ